MSVLIVTMPDDHHAHAVRWALTRLGTRADVIYPLDLSAGGAEWIYDPGSDSLRILSNGFTERVNFANYETVWMRRPLGVYPQPQIADVVERSAAEGEFAAFADGVLCALERGKFVVNTRRATRAASYKALQLAVASKIGLTIPDTVISNARGEILEKFEHWGGEIIYKTLKPTLWTHPDGSKSSTFTHLITDRSKLEIADLLWGPGIFQRKVNKVKEIRAIFMGRSVFAWEKTFEDPTSVGVDWRIPVTGATHKRHFLPERIAQKCYRLLDSLELIFGCIDLAVDESGKYVFFEVNPQGQFLWGDTLGIELNLLEAFAEFLISRDIDFNYSERNAISWNDFINDVDIYQQMSEEKANHFGVLGLTNYNQVCVEL